MPAVLASALSREHARELGRLEKAELKRLLSIYEEGRQRILGRLGDVRADKFTAQHLRGTRLQIESGLRTMLKKLDEQASDITTDALDQGIEQTLAEIAVFQPKFREGPFGRIQTDALRRVSAPRNLLLHQYKASLAAYGENVIGDVQRRLGVHLAMRSTWRDMSVDVAGRLSKHGIVGARWRAERIVRTELIDALNAGHYAALEASTEAIPGLMGQWDARLDARTSKVCERFNGRVRAIGKPFGLYRGRPILRPPAIPNCRSRVVPWHQEWEEAVARTPKAELEQIERTPAPRVAKPLTPKQAQGKLAAADATYGQVVAQGGTPQLEPVRKAAQVLYTAQGLTGSKLTKAVTQHVANTQKKATWRLKEATKKARAKLSAAEKKWTDTYVAQGGKVDALAPELGDELTDVAAIVAKLQGDKVEDFTAARLAAVAKRGEEILEAKLGTVKAALSEARAAYIEGSAAGKLGLDLEAVRSAARALVRLQAADVDVSEAVSNLTDEVIAAAAKAAETAKKALLADAGAALDAYVEKIATSKAWTPELMAAKEAAQKAVTAHQRFGGLSGAYVEKAIKNVMQKTLEKGRGIVVEQAGLKAQAIIEQLVAAGSPDAVYAGGIEYIKIRRWVAKLHGEEDTFAAAKKAIEGIKKNAQNQITKAAIAAEKDVAYHAILELSDSGSLDSEKLTAAKKLLTLEHPEALTNAAAMQGVKPAFVKTKATGVLKEHVENLGKGYKVLLQDELAESIPKSLKAAIDEHATALGWSKKKQAAFLKKIEDEVADAKAEAKFKAAEAEPPKAMDAPPGGVTPDQFFEPNSLYFEAAKQHYAKVAQGDFLDLSAELQWKVYKANVKQVAAIIDDPLGVTGPSALPWRPGLAKQSGAPGAVKLPNGKVANKTAVSKGSNPGGFYQTHAGEELFIKFPPSVGQVGAEQATAELARLMGLTTKEYSSFAVGTKNVASASPKIKFTGLTGQKIAAWKNRDELANHFVHAAWTRNWDVVGTGYDNMVKLASGDLGVVDYGGSLLWRAQGALKPDGMPKIVKEIVDLRDATKNSYTAKAFAELTDEDLAKAIQAHLAELDDDAITQAVTRGNFMPADQAVIEKGLLERKAWLEAWAEKVLPAQKGTAAEIRQALLGDLPDEAAGALKLKPGKTFNEYTTQRYASARQGDATAMAKLGRGLWVGTDELVQDQDLALRLLQTAWNLDESVVQSQLSQFETTKALLEALKAKGKGRTSTIHVRHALKKAEIALAKAAKQAEIAAAKEAKEAAAKAAKQKAEFEVKQAERRKALLQTKAELAKKLEAYEKELAAYKPKLEAWEAAVHKVTGTKTTKAGAVTAAYRRKLEKWSLDWQKGKRAPDVKERARLARSQYDEANRELDAKLALEAEELASLEKRSKIPWNEEGHLRYSEQRELKVLRRNKRNASKQKKQFLADFRKEIEDLLDESGAVPAKPVRPKPPPGIGGRARPEGFHTTHPSWSQRGEEFAAIAREQGISASDARVQQQKLESAIQSWKGQAAGIRTAQAQKHKGIPRDDINEGYLKRAEAFETPLWENAKGHDGHIWRGETFASDDIRTAPENEAWLKAFLEENVGGEWEWPYSAGWSTSNGYQGHGYGGSYQIQYHLRGRSGARSFAKYGSHPGELELQTRPGSKFVIESYEWFEGRSGPRGHRVHINLVEVFDDGTTGLD